MRIPGAFIKPRMASAGMKVADTIHGFMCGSRRPHRGMIFVTTLGIIVILSGLLLVFAQSMRTEAASSANRKDYIQADAIEQGAERWVLAQVEAYRPDALTITQVTAQAMPVGDGYFWIVCPNPASDQTYNFGIVDECSKLNLNVVGVTSPNHLNPTNLVTLPNMTQQIADAISDWHNPAAMATSDGAESSYYESLPEGYSCKNASFDTVEELLLVEGVTPDLLYGIDLNRDGVIDASEQQAAGGAVAVLTAGLNGGVVAARGWADDFTAYTIEPNLSSTGRPRVNVNDENTTRLQRVLSSALGAARAAQIIALTHPTARGRRGAVAAARTHFGSLGSFYNVSRMTTAEFKMVIDRLTATNSTTLMGMVNVNTAPEEVLMCLNGLTQSDADALIAQRQNEADLTTVAWVYDALTKTKASGILNSITARSYQYSADIVAVSGDGRSFKRVRIVVDASTLPAKVVYRRELTSLGWPLPVDVRTALRTGKPIPTYATSSPIAGTGAQGLGGGSLP